MNQYACLAVHDVACVAGICYLVTADSPWWAAALLLSLLTTSAKG